MADELAPHFPAEHLALLSALYDDVDGASDAPRSPPPCSTQHVGPQARKCQNFPSHTSATTADEFALSRRRFASSIQHDDKQDLLGYPVSFLPFALMYDD